MSGLPREFVDTNILIYAFDSTAGDKRKVAVELISRLWLDRAGCLSLQVLQEFYVAATRKLVLAPEQAALQVSRLGPMARAPSFAGGCNGGHRTTTGGIRSLFGMG